MEKRLTRIRQQQRALDIGAGDGAFVQQLVVLGFKRSAVWSHQRASAASPEAVRHLLINDFFRAEAFEENSFDVITCFQTLEHVDQPNQLFSDVHRLLRSGGAFMTVAHNSERRWRG